MSIRASERATEIFVVDQRFRRVASGVGSLELELDPGIYKVRFRAGAAQHDQLIEISPDKGSVNVKGDPVGFRSAAPIADTSTMRGHHQYVAVQQSRNVHVSEGHGSQLFIFSRDLEHLHVDRPWTGVSVHGANGDLIAGLDSGTYDEDERWAALTLELDPGTYRLRVETEPLGKYEMFVVACPGWQTQVFMLMTEFEVGNLRISRSELRSASVLMARVGRGFDAHREDLRLTELARLGLESGRNVINPEELEDLLRAKFDDPMLGIFAAHLLLLHRSLNNDLIEDVAAKLHRLLEISHPDVQALSLRHGATSRTEKPVFLMPPMLKSSWDLITRASIRRSSIVPAGSLADLVGESVLSTGPWLLNRVPRGQDKRTPTRLPLASMYRRLEELARIQPGPLASSILKNARKDPESFTPLEQKIIKATVQPEPLASKSQKHQPASEQEPAGEPPNPNVAQIIRQLRAPTNTIARSVDSLMTKLNLPEAEDS